VVWNSKEKGQHIENHNQEARAMLIRGWERRLGRQSEADAKTSKDVVTMISSEYNRWDLRLA